MGLSGIVYEIFNANTSVPLKSGLERYLPCEFMYDLKLTSKIYEPGAIFLLLIVSVYLHSLLRSWPR